MSRASRSAIPWAFRTRFRRAAFGWRGSKLAIERIHEALSEILAVARHDPVGGAEGAVILLEKLSPALCEVDSSSGALGHAAHVAVETLVPLIARAPVDTAQRSAWLERLYVGLGEDDPPYIESLGDHWGDLCGTEAMASAWADRLLRTLRSVLKAKKQGSYAFFRGASLCYSALFKAGRHDEILDLLAQDGKTIWPYLVWGGRVLAARGQIDEAIAYVSTNAGTNRSPIQIACFAEDLLLKADRRAEAFERYALLAHQANTHLATYRALAKRYPEYAPQPLLNRLIDTTPGEPGKWFATAKTLKRYEEATKLAWASPCDPNTLLRAARDHLEKQPAFAMQCALAALHWMAQGHGYEISTLDVRQAQQFALQAATAIGQTEQTQDRLQQLLATDTRSVRWVREALGMNASRT